MKVSDNDNVEIDELVRSYMNSMDELVHFFFDTALHSFKESLKFNTKLIMYFNAPDKKISNESLLYTKYKLHRSVPVQLSLWD